MPSLSMAKVKSGAKLLRKLLAKVDSGDGVLTESEVRRATNSPVGKHFRKDGTPLPQPKPRVDQATLKALLAAVWKKKSAADRSLGGIQKGVDEALKEIVQANADHSAMIADAEQKKVKSALGKALLGFSRLHGGDSISDFKLAAAGGDVYVPTTPFHMPAGASAADVVEALMTHFNAYSNDNRAGPGPQGITRYVLGAAETRGVVAAVGKMPAATARSVLRALAKRIQQADQRGTGFQPRRIWVDKKGVPLLNALAKKLGVKADFVGNAEAPKFDYF